jgi:hypothetical protein
LIHASGAGRFARHRTRCAAVVLGLTVVLSGCSTAAGAGAGAGADSTYGALPTFLPTASLKPDGVLTGTAERPALTIEGDAVRVRTSRGTVLATVAGPEVPGQGLPYQGPSPTCTWTVSLSAASGRIPLSVDDFSSTDHLGTIYHPTVVAGSRPPPTVLAPGQTVTFRLRAVMRTGEGLMRWAPERQVLAAWDFVVETD